MSDRARVLLVEPWYGGSHRAWADGLVAHSAHEVELLTLPDRFWRWRLRGAAVTLAAHIDEAVAARGRPDVLVVSDMVDLAALVGLARRSLAGVPVVLYLHESQLLRPAFTVDGARPPDHDAVYANWRSMAAADEVWCNSAFHRDALLAALPGFLAEAPDEPHTELAAAVAERTSVLPVGVELDRLLDGDREAAAVAGRAGDAPWGRPDRGPLVLWNQRWDHDKDPARFLGVLGALADADVAFRLALAGENRRTDPHEFAAAIDRLGGRVVHAGYLDRPDYEGLLLAADVVVSTARHEFFGIAVVEAMAAGCVPLLPDRLSYPELVPAAFADAVLYRGQLFDRLAAVLGDLDRARARVAGLRPTMARFAWPAVAPAYDEALRRVAALG